MILTGGKTRGRGTSVDDVGARKVAAAYHVPISNTAGDLTLLEPAG